MFVLVELIYAGDGMFELCIIERGESRCLFW